MKDKSKTIKLLRVLAAIVGISSAVIFVPWSLVFAWLPPLTNSIDEELNRALEQGFDGAIVYVDKGGEAPQRYSAGYHDRALKTPADPDALFKIASIGKLYVAAATVKLVNEKRLSLDGTVAEYFPDLKERIENSESITLRMMLRHRSGIPNYIDSPRFSWDELPQNDREAIELALDLPASFAPDSDYEYSNTNYMLLAELMDKTLGYSHFEYIRQTMLKPLGITDMYNSIREAPAGEVMSGYYVGIEDDLKQNYYGSMIATAQDVAVFLRALNDGSLLNDKEQAIYKDVYKFEHTGLVPGYQSIARYDSGTDTVIIQFTNTTNFQGYNWELSEILYSRISKLAAVKGER
ncbi:MAG: serine hydrolase domain-containing protein [Psychrobium sp.]